MTWLDYTLIALAGAGVFFAIRNLLRHKGGGCCGDCAHCHADCGTKRGKNG